MAEKNDLADLQKKLEVDKDNPPPKHNPDPKSNIAPPKPAPVPPKPKDLQVFEVECKWARQVVKGVKVMEEKGLHSCMRDVYEARMELQDPVDNEVYPRAFLEVQSLEPHPFREKCKYKVTIELVKE